jgi:hypothetical protein
MVMGAALGAVVLAACTARPRPTDETSAPPASRDFLADGKTTKEDVRTRLGVASGEFERGRIWTYRGVDVTHHLVVVFDDQGVVTRHRIVTVR